MNNDAQRTAAYLDACIEAINEIEDATLPPLEREQLIEQLAAALVKVNPQFDADAFTMRFRRVLN